MANRTKVCYGCASTMGGGMVINGTSLLRLCQIAHSWDRTLDIRDYAGHWGLHYDVLSHLAKRIFHEII